MYFKNNHSHARCSTYAFENKLPVLFGVVACVVSGSLSAVLVLGEDAPLVTAVMLSNVVLDTNNIIYKY